MGCMDQLGGLLYVLRDRIMGAVEHDGGEASLDTLIAALIGAVV